MESWGHDCGHPSPKCSISSYHKSAERGSAKRASKRKTCRYVVFKITNNRDKCTNMKRILRNCTQPLHTAGAVSTGRFLVTRRERFRRIHSREDLTG